MSFLQKIQQPVFWKNVAKVAIPFFIAVTLISLIMNSSRDIFAGDFAAVNEANFTQGKWIRFWGIKALICFFYGIWITNKKMA